VSASGERLDLRVERTHGAFRLAVDEAVALDGVTALFGRSGSGKTSLLRAIAGLDRPDAGRIALGETVWFNSADRTDMPAHRRGVGYMFQDGRLFTHLDVAGNLRFAERRSRTTDDRFGLPDVAEATGLAAMLDRRVDTLSGGERQRVALARTLLSRPRLLLLDEPLTGLDRSARRAILPYLRDVPSRFGIPAIYVSHDLEEAAALASRILVLDEGQVSASGLLVDVARTLDLAPLAGQGGAGALVEAKVVAHDAVHGTTQLDLGGQTLSLPLDESLSTGSLVRLMIRAEDVSIAIRRPEGISIRNILPATVKSITPAGERAEVEIALKVGPAMLRSRITRAAYHDLQLSPGLAVFTLIKSVSLSGL